jgi:hypothetical protein
MGLSPAQLEEIHIASILHDVGKIGISELIIGKPGRLSREEFAIMKDHPAHGLRILEPIGFSPSITSAIYQHHERFDGDGYPQGLAGDQISLAARILNVADTIDAMVSERPYRGTISSQEVLLELERESGRQFDPLAAASAQRLIEKGLLKLGQQSYYKHPAAVTGLNDMAKKQQSSSRTCFRPVGEAKAASRFPGARQTTTSPGTGGAPAADRMTCASSRRSGRQHNDGDPIPRWRRTDQGVQCRCGKTVRSAARDGDRQAHA